jgi:hypothetical protein
MEYKQGAERPNHAGGPAHKPTGLKKVGKVKRVVGAIVASVVLVAVLAWSTVAILTSTGVIGPNASINKDDYQAVFLTNGQVYFGKLQNAKGEYLQLTDIYYLQVDSSIQSGEEAQAAASDNNVQLIKLGNELHGPRDEMQISNQQVLFWENLKPDSRVSEAIKNYKE